MAQASAGSRSARPEVVSNLRHTWLTTAIDEGRGTMASKDKGGANVKKKAQHNLKEKRQAKKAKKTGK